jgi:hypothetical protein
MVSSDFSSGLHQDFTLRLIPAVTLALRQRPDETSPVPSPAVATSHTPYAGEFFAAVHQVLRTNYVRPPLLLPSPCVTGSAPSFSLFWANISALLAKPRFAIHFMLQAAALLLLLEGVQRFNIASRLATSVACYLAT